MARTTEPGFEELHQTEERLQAVIASAPVGILEVDLESRVIRWNPAAERIFGWSRDEIIGRPDVRSRTGKGTLLRAEIPFERPHGH